MIKQIGGFIVIVFFSALISALVYLILMPADKKPSTYKQITFGHFFKNPLKHFSRNGELQQ